MNHPLISMSASPTTVRPMTAPARNAIVRPRLRDSLAPCAVRDEAAVAVFIPTNPARPLKSPPVMNANGTSRCCTPSPNAMNASAADSTMKTIPTTTYCRLR
jgi:hypothetical protein